MSKYTFDRLGADRFETLVQALLEGLRATGHLIQFGAGKDGGREATWTQPVDHPTYRRPTTEPHDVPKEWVFQAKYHDLGIRGWEGARTQVESELQSELTKITSVHKVPCHHYVLVTNVPFSGVRHVGTRDRVNAIRDRWQAQIPEIDVWDATDLSRMIDANPGVRTTYLDDILPGDVLRELLYSLDETYSRRAIIIRTYLRSLLRSERDARAEEAGDESPLPLEKVFVDLNVRLAAPSRGTPHTHNLVDGLLWSTEIDTPQQHLPDVIEGAPASFVFLRATHDFMLLKGGPGVGKSTITQFLTLYHAARVVDTLTANRLTAHLKLTGDVTPETLDGHVRPRIPFRIELRRYAQWTTEREATQQPAYIADYLAARVGTAASTSLGTEDFFSIARGNPILVILDGLDEVPHPNRRARIFEELDRFVDRCGAEPVDFQLILSSRPQGYHGEYDRFTPVEWHVCDLDRKDFDSYAGRWISARITGSDERADAMARIEMGLRAPAVQQLASTLLQATVMLTIARRKHAIPHARHKLYEKYVEVVFQREQNKQTVQAYETPLMRLHELVGYRLLCRMASDSGGSALPALEFRRAVRQVFEEFGDRSAGASVSEVVDQIATLATDRLCFLAGKGEQQADVDFIIQPFREYFAAAYLAHHEEAQTDSVYEALSTRAHVWMNVLQFYCAFRSSADQKNWINEADCADIRDTGWAFTVSAFLRRQVLVRVLPEFSRPKNEYIRRAFANVLQNATRWLWAESSEIGPLLRAFVGDEALAYAREFLLPLSESDPQALFAELTVLVGVAGQSELARGGPLTAELDELMAKKDIRDVVLDIAWRHDIAINVAAYFDDLVVFLCERCDGRPSGEKFFSSLTDEQCIALQFSVPPWFRRGFTGSQVDIVALIRPADTKVRLGQDNLPKRTSEADEVRSALELLGRSRPKHAAYLRAVLEYRAAPTDKGLWEAAVQHESALGEELHHHLRISDPGSGARPDHALADVEWAEECNRLLVANRQAEQDWLSRVGETDGSWLTVYVHPDFWSSLQREVIHSDSWFWIEEKRSIALEVARPVFDRLGSLVYPRRVRVSLEQCSLVCASVIGVAERHGPGALRDLEFPSQLLFGAGYMRGFHDRRNDRGERRAQVASVVARAAAVVLPRNWARVVLGLGGALGAESAADMLEIWRRIWPADSTWFAGVGVGGPPNPDLIAALLETGTTEALALSATLWSGTGLGSRRAEGYDARIVPLVCGVATTANEYRRLRMWIKLLVFQPDVSRGELLFWRREDVRSEITHDCRLAGFVAARVRACGGLEMGHADLELLEDLGYFIENRTAFPREVPTAAAGALLRLKETMAAPLTDGDWQRREDGRRL